MDVDVQFLLFHRSFRHDVRYFPETPENEIYLSKMPWDLYKSYYVPTLGYFWLDDARDCIKTTLKEGKVWEPYILNVIKKYLRPGGRAVDIGSHIGTISLQCLILSEIRDTFILLKESGRFLENSLKILRRARNTIYIPIFVG
jgi:hypothetical protein